MLFHKSEVVKGGYLGSEKIKILFLSQSTVLVAGRNRNEACLSGPYLIVMICFHLIVATLEVKWQAFYCPKCSITLSFVIIVPLLSIIIAQSCL